MFARSVRVSRGDVTTTIQSAFLGRCLRLLLIGALLLAAAPARADDEGFRNLFNGTDLSGWEGNPKFWSVEEGCITGRTTAENPTDGNTFLLWRDGEVDDFELRLQYRIVGGNSGVQYRSSDLGNWVVGGYQADFEAGDTYSGILYEERGRGILGKRGEKVVIEPEGNNQVVGAVGDSAAIQAQIRPEQWNEYVITAEGNHLVHKINGHVTVDVTDEQATHAHRWGVLALQLHAGPPMTVQFKDVRIKRLRLQDRKKIVLIAGRPSHGPGDHEFNAGVLVLRKCLDNVPGVVAANYHGGWPRDPSAFDNADTILFYMDGGSGHPLIQEARLAELEPLMKQGVGLCCAHYAVEVPAERGGPELLNWIGGYYETGFSINPHWNAKLAELPEHPITRGVKPFEIVDEWYYNIRLREGAITPLLVASPPDESRKTPAAAEHPGRPEVLAWCMERPDGGRGFGFTGGHFHRNWADDNFRKLVLNALLWSAKGEVPADGVASTVTPEEMAKNLDPK